MNTATNNWMVNGGLVNGQLFYLFQKILSTRTSHYPLCIFQLSIIQLSIIHCSYEFSNKDALGKPLRKWVIKIPDKIQLK